MPVSFNSIPASWKLPLYWVEVDPSRAGLPFSRMKSLLVGIMTSDGDAVADVPIPIATQAVADARFGPGSQLAMMFKAYFANNFANEVWAAPVAEPSGDPADGTITISTPPTAAGTIHWYIAGEHIPITVAASESVADIATALALAINDNDNLPVTATSDQGVVTVTCKWQGTSGNDITMQDTYYGAIGGEALPVGVTIAYSGSGLLADGTGVPDFSALISNLGEEDYEFVAQPFTDSTSLSDFETEWGFSDTGRWGWMRQLFGHLFSAARGDFNTLQSLGGTRNAPQSSIMGVEITSPSPVFMWAAAYCAKAARALINDPARPLQTLHFEGILPAKSHERFLSSELNALAMAGIATQHVKAANLAQIARETTTYTLNLYGLPDDAYEVVTTLSTLAKILRNQRQVITTKFPRHKLANDGTRFGLGQAIVTPKSVKAELVAQYRIDEFNGLVEDAQAFKQALIVERDPNDPNRLNVLFPPDLVNQLRVFAVLAQFRLQVSRGVDFAIL